MRTHQKTRTAISTLAIVLIGLVSCPTFGADRKATDAESGKATNRVSVGGIAVSMPPQWRMVSGSEESQVKTEIKQGIDQMMERYRESTGMEHGAFGLRDFKALRLPNDSGWCILHLVRIPPQTDYYATMASDTKQKLDWGLSKGIFERIVENGLVKVGDQNVMRTIVRKKGGGRMITVIHWSPNEPSAVTQLIILESKTGQPVPKQIDDVLASLKMEVVKRLVEPRRAAYSVPAAGTERQTPDVRDGAGL